MAEVTKPSVRGLSDGYQRTPLRKFRGKLDSITVDMREVRDVPGKMVAYNILNFSELDVIESREPYPFPIAYLDFPASNRKKSLWGIFGESTLQFLGETEDVEALIGRTLLMELTPSHMLWDGRTNSEQERECWELMDVVGAKAAATVGVDATIIALRLLDGKTEQEWNQVVFQDEVVKQSNIISTIIGRAFIPEMVKLGKLTMDDNGVYHVKEG